MKKRGVRFPWGPARGIAGRIVLLLLCFAVLPMTVLSLVFFLFSWTNHKKDIIRLQRETAQRVGDGVAFQLEKNLDSLKLLAYWAEAEAEAADLSRFENLLSTFLLEESEFDTLGLALPDGRVIHAVSRFHTYEPGEPESIGEEQGFRKALEKTVALGDVKMSPFSRFPQLRLYTPVVGMRDRVTGVVYADMNVSRMWRLVARSFIGESLDAYIIDEYGSLIAFDELSAVLERRSLTGVEGVTRFLAGEEGVLRYEGIRGAPVLGVVSRIPLTGWGVVVETPLHAAHGNFNFLWGILGALSLAMILCATFFGLWFSTRSIVRPIRKLQKDVQILATGNLDHRIDWQREDELGRLAQGLVSMAENLRSTTVSRDMLFEENEQRRKTESALRKSERQLADIIDFLPDATLAVDSRKRIIIWNRAIEEMTGIRASEMLGQGDYAYTVPFYGERRPQLMDLIFEESEDVEDKYPFIFREGHSLITEVFCPALHEGRGAYVFAKASPLHDQEGKVVGAIESIRDVTDRRQAEEGLQLLAAALDQTAEAILITDPAGDIVFANPAFERITGYKLEEVLGRNPRLLKSGEHDTAFYQSLWETITSGEVWTGRLVNRRKDGELYTEYCTISPVRDRSGSLSHFVCVKRDITENLKYEERLKQVQRLESIGVLAGGIAHDFNNILTPIMGYTEMALRELPPDDRLRRSMEQVYKCSRRAKDLVHQILAFSRQTEQERSPVRVAAVVKEALSLLRATLPATVEIHRSFHSDASELVVMADPTQLHQIVMNLCTNAAHAMRQKGGVLEVGLEPVETDGERLATQPILSAGSYLRLRVSDTGTGMDEGIVNRIFDPYFTTKAAGEGTGLGLAVVYGIVKQYGGAVAVESHPGKGSVFKVLLPLANIEEAQSMEELRPLPQGKGRILLVDDEEEVVKMPKEMLELLGYEVTARCESSEALETFLARPDDFDAVLTDQTMPRMTGAELAAEILKVRPQRPVVLCTGFSEAMSEERAKQLGIRAFLMKPLSMQQLASTLHDVLGSKA